MSCQLLHRVDPDLNMARFYRVEMLPDLFGEIIVERRWGRIGGRGQSQSASYRSTSLAEAAACELVRQKCGAAIASLPVISRRLPDTEHCDMVLQWNTIRGSHDDRA